MATNIIILAVVLLLVPSMESQRRGPDPAPPCTSPPIIPNSNHTYTEVRAGSIVNYTCWAGYQARGSQQKTCRDGRWVSSGVELSCDPTYCSRPPSINSGHFSSSIRYTVGTVVTYNCYSGYYLNGTNSQIACQADGTWTSPLPRCEKKSCGAPSTIEGGNVSFTSTLYLEQAIYSCNDGYSLYSNGYQQRNNRLIRRCLSNGDWTEAPQCRPKDCGLPPNIRNGVRFSYGNHLYGQEVVYECNHGYIARFNTSITCLASGRWSLLPECTKVTCDSAPTVANAISSNSGKAFYGNATRYTCLKGFEMHGFSRITCQADGTWTKAPMCTAVDCRTPPAIHFGQHTWNSTTYNSISEYTCDKGYKLIGVAKIYCQQDGRWNEAPRCEMPPVPPEAAAKSAQVSEAPAQNSSVLTGLSIACALFGVITLLCIIALIYKMFCSDRKLSLFSYASYKNGDDSINGI